MPLRMSGNLECERETAGTGVSELLIIHSKFLQGQVYIPRGDGRSRKRGKQKIINNFPTRKQESESTDGLALGLFLIVLPWRISRNE
jgi:hypothetical protein